MFNSYIYYNSLTPTNNLLKRLLSPTFHQSHHSHQPLYLPPIHRNLKRPRGHSATHHDHDGANKVQPVRQRARDDPLRQLQRHFLRQLRRGEPQAPEASQPHAPSRRPAAADGGEREAGETAAATERRGREPAGTAAEAQPTRQPGRLPDLLTVR